MKSSTYMDSALRNPDRRFAEILGKLGYTPTAEVQPDEPETPALESKARKGKYQRRDLTAED